MPEEIVADEVWTPVPGWERVFAVARDGRVKSVRTGRELVQIVGKTGYLQIATRLGGRKGKAVCVKVHRLLAAAFVPASDGRAFVNHRNGVKTDNRIENLEWMTVSENLRHAWANGLMRPRFGVDTSCAKLTEDDVRFIRRVYRLKDSRFGARALARQFGVHHKTIRQAAERTTWRHVS